MSVNGCRHLCRICADFKRLAAVEKAIVTANQESSSIRKNLNQTNKRLAKTEKLAKDTNKEFYNFQVSLLTLGSLPIAD